MNEKTEIKVDMIKNLALLLIEQNNQLTIEQALSIIFNSDTYLKIMDEQTRLYCQSPRYVFAYLNEELKNGQLS